MKRPYGLSRKEMKKNIPFYVLLAPFFTLFCVFMLIPVLAAVLLSFTDFNMVQTPNIVGLSNYVRIFIDDEIFMIALKNTLIYAVITGPVGFLISFVVAWLINEMPRAVRTGVTLLMYAPTLAGNVYFVWQYGEVIAEFGTYSEQTGGFTTPVAVESIGDTVYVLDAGKNAIQSFRPSDYGKLLRKAFLMLNTTDTDAALDIWSQVMQLSTNSQYAYYGIGTVYDTLGEYEKAMEYFKLAGAHEEYSKSLREYRKEFVNEQYLWIILVVVVLVLAISWVVKAIKKRSVLVDGTAYSALETKYLFPVYTTLHPADGFAQFKDRKIHSLRLSVLLMVAWFFLDTFSFFYTGYSFNMDRPMDYNFATTLLFTIGLMVLFIIANWSVCTLLNGKGTLKEITATCSYALVPYLISILVNTLLSNILTGEEAAIMTIISAIGLLWSALLLFIGLQSIHQYGFAGTFFSIILTIFGMAIICFLLLLFYTLVQQAVSFIKSVYTELSLR